MVALAKSACRAAASAWSCSSEWPTWVTDAGGSGVGSSAYAGSVVTASNVPSATSRSPRRFPNPISPPFVARLTRKDDRPPRLSQPRPRTVGTEPGMAECDRSDDKPGPIGGHGSDPGHAGGRASYRWIGRLVRPTKVHPMASHFDVVVLGAGPGGYVAAIRAAQLGLKTAIIEKKYWGGVCLNVGCIPSKALLRNAELAHIFRAEAKTFGISGEVSFDFQTAVQRSRKVADGRVKGVHFLMKKNNITEFDGWGTFVDANTLDVSLNDGNSETVTFDNCIIATGATTIGVEFAYVLSNYGVKVTIVEFLDRIVPLEDVEVSKELAKAYKKLGVDVLTGTRVDAIDDSGDIVKVTVTGKDGNQQTLEADKVLQAIGFQPRVDGYGLDKIGVQLTERGAIAADGFLRTNVPNIFAIGDVNAKLMLAHAAEAQGVIAAETIAGVETMELDHVMIPRATFCQPQIASFGWTEEQARLEGYDVNAAKVPFPANGKAHGLGDPSGFLK